MSDKLKILYKEVGKRPKPMEIEDTLEAKQKLVGGLIEVVPYIDNMLLICNEEGKKMKKSFYLKYQEQNKEKVKQKKIKQKYKLDDNTLVVEKSSNFFIAILGLIKSGVKVLGYILLMIFISLGITAIVNQNIREILLNYIFGG